MSRTFAEPLVARVLGVHKKIVAKARREAGLVKGVDGAAPADWLLVNSCVEYTQAGLEKVCAALGLAAGAGLVMAQPADAAGVEFASREADPDGVDETEGSVATEEGSAPPLNEKFAATFHAKTAETLERIAMAGFDKPAAAPTTFGIGALMVPVAAVADAVAGGVVAAAVAVGVVGLERKDPGPVEIVVDRLSRNPRIVIGTVAGREVSVVVRENVNFRRGMRLQADPVNEHVYRMVGRCPRWPGRW